MGRHQCSAVTTAIEIAPVCEEILKLLPLLLYFLIFEPDSHKLTPAAIGIAVGFATFENVCYLTENGAGSFVFLLIRGMSAGALHLVCGILTGLALAYVFRRPWLTCTGTVGILGVCMVLHGIYNLLITADGFWQMVGYFFPSAIIVTLFAARLLHRGQAHCFSLTVSRSFPEREIFLNFFQIWVKGIGANCIIGDREDGKQPL